MLATHHHLVLRLRMSGAIRLLLYAFMAWTGRTLPLHRNIAVFADHSSCVIIEAHALGLLVQGEWGSKSYLRARQLSSIVYCSNERSSWMNGVFFKMFLVSFFFIQCKFYRFNDLIIFITSSLVWIRVYQVSVIEEAMVWIGITHWRIINMPDFRLPRWCKWDLHCSGILCSIDWRFVTDISGQPIGPIFKGQAVQEECQEHLGTQVQRECCGRWLVIRERDTSH
jgi:hypothetical protein